MAVIKMNQNLPKSEKSPQWPFMFVAAKQGEKMLKAITPLTVPTLIFSLIVDVIVVAIFDLVLFFLRLPSTPPFLSHL